jgi:hypothetical protein
MLARHCSSHGVYTDRRGCPSCRSEREKQRGTRQQRGLGEEHQRRRAALKASGANV